MNSQEECTKSQIITLFRATQELKKFVLERHFKAPLASLSVRALLSPRTLCRDKIEDGVWVGLETTVFLYGLNASSAVSYSDNY